MALPSLAEQRAARIARMQELARQAAEAAAERARQQAQQSTSSSTSSSGGGGGGSSSSSSSSGSSSSSTSGPAPPTQPSTQYGPLGSPLGIPDSQPALPPSIGITPASPNMTQDKISTIPSPGIIITETPSGEIITQVTLRPGESSNLGWTKGTPYTEYQITGTDTWIQGEPPSDIKAKGGYSTREVTPMGFSGTITPPQKQTVTVTYPDGRTSTGAFAGQRELTPEEYKQKRMDDLLKSYDAMPSGAAAVRAVTIAYGSIFRPETWLEFAKGGIYGGKGAAKAAYSTLQWESGFYDKPAVQKWTSFQTPAYENVIIPFATGYAFGGAASYLGKSVYIGKSLTTGQKVYNVAAKGILPAAGYTYAGLIGAEIGYTAAAKPEELELLLAKTSVQLGFVGLGVSSYKPLSPKISLTYLEQEGVLSAQKYYDFGKFRLPVSRTYNITVKPQGFTWAGEPMGEPLGLASPWDVGVKVRQPGMTVAQWNNKIFVDTGMGWQPKTGIPEPGVYKPGQMIIRPTGTLTAIPTPGKIIIYEPLLPFYSLTESQFINMKYFAKGMEWQPKTGIDFPKPDKITIEPPSLQDVFKTDFRVKPPKDIVTKIDITPEGILSVKKYGRSFLDTGVTKNISGIPEPGVYKPGQMIIRPPTDLMPLKYNLVGRMVIFDFGFKDLFSIKIIPKTRKLYTLKDIVKPDGFDKGTISTSSQNQQTVQILKTKTIQEPMVIQIQEQMQMQKIEQLQIQIPRTESVTELFDMSHPFYDVGKISISQNKLKTSSDIRYGFGSESLFETVQKQNEAYIQLSRLEQPSVSVSFSKSLFSFEQASFPAYDYIQDSVQVQLQEQQQISLQEIGSLESVSDLTILQTTRYQQPRITTRFDSPEIKIPRIPRVPFILDDEPLQSDRGQGYDVLIKDRVYVSGKKKYDEKFFKANTKPLTRYDALSLGASAADNSAAATFKIIRAGNRKARPLDMIVSDWDILQHQFTEKNNRFIEKREHRINTPGEIQQISAQGWLAQQRKGVMIGFGF